VHGPFDLLALVVDAAAAGGLDPAVELAQAVAEGKVAQVKGAYCRVLRGQLAFDLGTERVHGWRVRVGAIQDDGSHRGLPFRQALNCAARPIN
jgi:hypothetical protein